MGGIRSDWLIWILYYSQFARYFTLTCAGMECLAAKYLSNVILHRILPVVDDFFALFLFVINNVIGFGLAYIFSFSFFAHDQNMALQGLASYANSNQTFIGNR